MKYLFSSLGLCFLLAACGSEENKEGSSLATTPSLSLLNGNACQERDVDPMKELAIGSELGFLTAELKSIGFKERL
jgi:hypothetical protein